MFGISILLLTILIPSIQSLKPALKLTFTPDEKYYATGRSVDISCEVINPADTTDAPQLWHVDLRTGKHTPISRSLINSPGDDSPDIFRQNRNQRLQYLRKNYLRLTDIQVEDTARYECNCPDCEEPLGKQEKKLQVMKLVEPKWHIEPGWPIQENAKTTIKCTVDDFYPYVSHKIIRQHHDVTKDGKSFVSNESSYPQRFSWEATVTPAADWHNTPLRCTVTQGSSEQHATKQLDVLFTPRFHKCDERQHVDSSKEKATIECVYAGNPRPELNWYRQTDQQSIRLDPGVNVEIKDELHGKYRSIVTFERDKLAALPLTTTTKSPGGQPDSTPQTKVSGENYYQQLLNGGFIAKLTYNNEDKDSRKISIVGDANQARSKVLGNSSRHSIANLSTSLISFSFLIILYMIKHH